MKYFLRFFYFLTLNCAFSILTLWTGSALNLHVYLGGFWVFLSVCLLPKFEGLWSVFFLCLLSEALYVQSFFGIVSCCLASSVLFFSKEIWKNICICRLRLSCFLFSLMGHILFLLFHLGLQSGFTKKLLYYLPSVLVLNVLLAFIVPYWLKFQRRYFV